MKKTQRYIPADATLFRPEKSELRLVETILKKAFQEQMLTKDFGSPVRLQEYSRQYLGYTDAEGNRIVFVQCFIREWERGEHWRENFFYVDDGCEGVFRVKINLKNHNYFNFNHNPCA